MEVTKGSWHDNLRDGVEELAQEAYENQGYLKAKARVEVKQNHNLGERRSINLILHITPGTQYRMGEVQWKGMHEFTEAQLNDLAFIEPGSIFSREKVLAMLDASKRLYAAHGYVNFVQVPEPRTDESSRTVNFDIDVFEGQQFRFGDLTIYGMEPKHAKILLSAWAQLRGQVFDEEASDRFFEHFFRSPLRWVRPKDYTEHSLDTQNRSVNFVLSLVRASQ